jgi:pimeloyl-ACP methyl ester carboxylesterase
MSEEEAMTNDTTTPSRRTIVGAMAAGTMAAVSAAGTAQAQTTPKTFVLAHGAWHGGWCWRRVSDRLEKGGHKVFTPTMTGLGERSHLLDPKVNLATHVTDIVNVIKWEGLSDIVLVGHSYGGMIISGVAEQMHEAIGSIVFLDAFVPENGEALVTLTARRQAIEELAQKGETSMKPVPAAVFQVNEKDRAWVDRMCTPHPLATLTDKITLTGARERIAKKSYIRATGYANAPFDAAQAKVKARTGWRVYEMPCGHDAMVDMPDRLTEIFLEVA